MPPLLSPLSASPALLPLPLSVSPTGSHALVSLYSLCSSNSSCFSVLYLDVVCVPRTCHPVSPETLCMCTPAVSSVFSVLLQGTTAKLNKDYLSMAADYRSQQQYRDAGKGETTVRTLMNTLPRVQSGFSRACVSFCSSSFTAWVFASPLPLSGVCFSSWNHT